MTAVTTSRLRRARQRPIRDAHGLLGRPHFPVRRMTLSSKVAQTRRPPCRARRARPAPGASVNGCERTSPPVPDNTQDRVRSWCRPGTRGSLTHPSDAGPEPAAAAANGHSALGRLRFRKQKAPGRLRVRPGPRGSTRGLNLPGDAAGPAGGSRAGTKLS